MTPRAITIRLAEPRDAQSISLMSRDFIEAGLGWKYDAPRVLRVPGPVPYTWRPPKTEDT